MNSSLILSNLLSSGIFLSILCANVWGLFRGLFGVSCQITVIIFLSLQIWLSIQVSSLSKGFIRYKAHLTPAGAPGMLVPFLNIVELISKLIRPLTLTLRLCINMTTGHILLRLLNLRLRYRLVRGAVRTLVLIGLILGYYLFELVICAIQASVYTLLVSQYLDEHTI
jgi:ATP synthase subunit 6